MYKPVFGKTVDKIVSEVEGATLPRAVDAILQDFAVQVIAEYARCYLGAPDLPVDALIGQVIEMAQHVEGTGEPASNGQDRAPQEQMQEFSIGDPVWYLKDAYSYAEGWRQGIVLEKECISHFPRALYKYVMQDKQGHEVVRYGPEVLAKKTSFSKSGS